MTEDKIIMLDEISEEVLFIPLETNDDILIKKIEHVFLHNNMIIVGHWGGDGRYSVFDIQGNYLRDLGRRGNGPGEFHRVLGGGTFVSDYFVINDTGIALHFYNLLGDYCYSLKTSHYMQKINLLSDNRLIGYLPYDRMEAQHCLISYDLNGSMLDSVPYPDKYITDNFKFIYRHRSGGSFHRYKELLFFHEIFNDTIFEVTPNLKLIPRITLGLSKYAPDIKAVHDLKKIEDIGNIEKHKEILNLLFENDRFLLLKSRNKKKIVVYDKKTKNITYAKIHYTIDKIGEIKKEGSGNFIFNPFNVSEDNKYLIGVKAPSEDAENNPMIILVKIKNSN